MKNLFYCLLLYLISNVLYAQEQIEKGDFGETAVFKFYPNPAQDELFILGTNKIKSIELLNVLGKRVAFYHFNKSIIKIDVSELNSGTYLIQAIDENDKAEIKKLVVK